MAFSDLAADARAEARELRRAIYADGDPTRFDLDRLIAKGREEGADSEFAELLADVAADVLVRLADPPGYVTDEDAAWLIERLKSEGGLASAAEFGMLKAIVSHAISVPSALSAFAVREVEKAILTGRRDVLGGVEHEPGVVASADVDELRAFAFAPAQGHSLHVDRATAEALFDIAHATATAGNAAEFPDFFAKAVGNYLMGADFLGTPERSEMLHTEAELARPGGFGAFFAQVFGAKPNLGEITETIGGDQEEADRALNQETAIRLEKASHIEVDDAKWVLAHLSRGGALTAAERRLLAFLRDEAASAPPELTTLYAQAA
jgi:hypothetical protein